MISLRRVRWKRVLLLGTLTSVVAGAALVGVGYAVTDVPEPSASSTAEAVVIQYADGTEMGQIGETTRRLVPLAEMSDAAQKAVLAAEDRGFYTNSGISLRGITRALFANVRGGEVSQGGSTITQQYAKNAFLTQDRTISRKVQEVFIALKMSRSVSKDQILEDYLNTIFFGRGAEGIEAAAEAYFGEGVRAADLTAAQGALLATSIRSPASYDPTNHPEVARERWEFVLDGMVEEGWLSPEERAAAVYPEVVDPATQARPGLRTSPEGHVLRQVLAELERAGFSEAGLSGLTVTTTIEPAAQAAAVAAVQGVPEIGLAPERTDLQGALVAVRPGTGEVVAYYGGSNGSGTDYAYSPGPGQQPGSSFKPYVLATALQQGISLRSTWDGNSPKDFPGGVEVENFDGSDAGRVDLVAATEDSVNTAYYELGLEVGTEAVAELARAAGIRSEGDSGSPLQGAEGTTEGGISLGSYEVQVLDHANGYATFANLGERVDTTFVKTVTDRDGEIVFQSAPERSRAFDEDVAADATFAMQSVIASGSGTRARLDGGRPAAGKTGTTTNSTDLWFAGFTPQLAAAVWIGYGDSDREVTVDAGSTGGRVSTGVWKAFMDAALAGQEELPLPERADVGDTDRGGEPVRPSATPAPQPTVTETPAPEVTATPEPTLAPEPTPEPTTPPPTTAPPTTAPPTTAPPTSAPPSASPAPTPILGPPPTG